MSEWKKCKLGEVARVQTGPFGSQLHQRDYRFEGTPIITVEHIGDNRIIHSDLPLVGEEDRERLIKYSLKTGDVIFSRVGSVDRCAYIHESENGWMFSGRLLRVRGEKEKVDSRFLSFYFSQESFRETIRMIAVGATMPSINTSILSDVEIILPSLPEQCAIAGVLSSLDDKIDLLHRQNKTLEAMAGALWRKMFVEEADPGWKKGKLGDICTNKKVKPDAKSEDYEYYVPIDCIEAQSLALVNFEPIVNAKSSIISFDENDILFGAMRPYFHKVALAPFKGLTRTTCFVLKPKDQVFLMYLLLLLFQKETVDYADNSSVGSTIPYAVWENGLSDMPILIPTEPAIIKFNTVVSPMISKIKGSFYQRKKLCHLRDILLPKLMSGEVRVRL